MQDKIIRIKKPANFTLQVVFLKNETVYSVIAFWFLLSLNQYLVRLTK
jgi:hypothetical protein